MQKKGFECDLLREGFMHRGEFPLSGRNDVMNGIQHVHVHSFKSLKININGTAKANKGEIAPI